MILGIIDLGSNSVKLSVYDYEKKREIFAERKVTRLGQDSFETKILINQAMARTLNVLRDFVHKAGDFGAVDVKIVATSCVRDAKNKEEFLALVKDDLGIEIKVISGDEEAEIIWSCLVSDNSPSVGRLRGFSEKIPCGGSGCLKNRSSSLKKEEELCHPPVKIFSTINTTPTLLSCDIGGGSTEFILGKEKIIFKKSLNIGAVRLYDMFFKNPCDKIGYEKALKYAENLIFPLKNDLKDFQCFVGSSGTFTNLFDWVKSNGLCEDFCERNVFIGEIHRLLEMPLEERKIQVGINPDRADIICAGGAIIEALCNVLNVKEIFVTTASLKDGLVLYYNLTT